MKSHHQTITKAVKLDLNIKERLDRLGTTHHIG
jgi:hypothetical protein